MDYAIRFNYYQDYWMIMEETFEYGSVNVNLENDINRFLCDINVRNPVKLRNNSPNILVKNGIKKLPMYENPVHIRKNILTEQGARKIGLKINRRKIIMD